MKKRCVLTVFCLLFLCGGITMPAYAQDQKSELYSFNFRGAPLQQVLEKVAQQANIDLVYDPQLVAGITVYDRVQDQPIAEVLHSVLDDTRLDFVILSSGTIVIVENVNENPVYGSYSGKVVDSRSGEPLPGATILLADASGGTSTSRSGTFAINKLMSGTHKIIFSYVGYESVSKKITIEPQENVRQKVPLDPKPVDFRPIVVKGDAPQLSYRNNGEQSVAADNQWQTPGSMQDAIRSLTLFPGVKYGLSLTDLHLQGGQSGGHRIKLDGVPVYNPHSFGQMFSAFSPYAINRIKLYKAGYGVDEGSQIAGLINMEHDINSVDQTQAMVQADPLSVNIRGDLALPLDDSGDDPKFKVMSAARFNYWNTFKDPILDQTLSRWNNLDPLVANRLIDSDMDASRYRPREQQADVSFYDLHLASRYNINKYETINTSFYVGKNVVNTGLLNQAAVTQSPEYLYARDGYRWNNIMGQATYNQLVSPRLDWSTQVSYSANKLQHRYVIGTSSNPQIELLSSGDAVYSQFASADDRNVLPRQQNENRIQHFTLRSDANYSISPNYSLEMGVEMDYVKSRVNFSDLFYLPTLTDQQSTHFSTYLNGHWRPGNYWKVTLGNRLTYTHSTNTVYSEPRGSIQYERPDSDIGYWSARFSGGLYRQFINQYEVTNPGPTSLVPSFTFWSHTGSSDIPKAWHLSGSFHLEPAQNTTVNVEWFYKWQPTAYRVSYKNLLGGIGLNRSDLAAFAEETTLKSLGAGLQVQQSVNQRLKLMLGYDYNFTRMNMETQFGRTMPPPWSEPHRLQLRSLWHLMPELTAVAKWQSVWGRTWGFRQSYYNYLLFESNAWYGGYTFDTPENDKMSPVHQFDFSLIYKPELSFMDLKVRANLTNVLDRRNTIDWSLRPDQSGVDGEYDIKKRTMPGFSPSLSIQVNL